MKQLLILTAATIALVTSIAASAATAPLPSAGQHMLAPATADRLAGFDQNAVARDGALNPYRAIGEDVSPDDIGRRVTDYRSQLALWMYCGMYSKPNGGTGIKCYVV